MMSRRMAVTSLMILNLSVACGSNSSERALELRAGTVTLKAERVGDSTVLSASSPVTPNVSVPDAALPEGVSGEDLSGSVTFLADPETGAVAVQFTLNPDGIRFEEPVDLSWKGYSPDSSTTAIMAISDSGENLLDQEEARKVLETLNRPTSDNGGPAPVSLEIDHFSTWLILQQPNQVNAVQLWDNQVVNMLTTSFEKDSWISISGETVAFWTYRWEVLGEFFGGEAEVCLEPSITVTGGARFVSSPGNECRDVNTEAVYEDSRSTLILTCPDFSKRGTVTVDFNAYFGVAGLKSIDKYIVLLASNEVTVEEDPPIEESDSFAAASDIAIFISGRMSAEYDCSEAEQTAITTTTTQAMTTSTTSSLVSTTAPSSTTMVIPPVSTTTKPSTTSPSSITTTTTGPRSTTTTAPVTTSVPRTTTTIPSYAPPSSSTTEPPSAPAGTWLRNDSYCNWRGSGSCGVYSSGSPYSEEVGPAGGPGSTFTPIAGTAGQLAYNLYAGNSIMNCDWNGSGGCGWYFSGTAGTLNLGPLG